MSPFRPKRISITPRLETDDPLWTRCSACRNVVALSELEERHQVCPECGHHNRIGARERIAIVADEGSFSELDAELTLCPDQDFPGYADKLATARAASGELDAVLTGTCTVGGSRAVIAVMDSAFMMGSMGAIVGERITRAVEHATRERIPVVIFTASGGARMQEGLVSLAQMAKVASALARHDAAGQLYITVVTDPTTGGVTASFASLGDIILAEPGALIGFAGRRVIESTTKSRLPEGFQTAESTLQHGFVDAIVARGEMRGVLAGLLRLHEGTVRGDAVVAHPLDVEPAEREEVSEPGANRSAWKAVRTARDTHRPTARHYIEAMCEDFFEQHGDRRFGDDPAIVSGIGWIAGQPVTVIGQDKGSTTAEKVVCNFGCTSPEGYRKAGRLMRQAEKFGRPVVTVIDTQGAFCGVGAEERGQGEAIARSLVDLATLRVPVVAVFVGEGGSGGALAFSVADRVGMLENAVFSILSPEGFASILWKDASRAHEAAEIMGLTAPDAIALGMADDLIIEPGGGAHKDPVGSMVAVGRYVRSALTSLEKADIDDLIDQRQKRFRRIGCDTL